MSDRIEKTIDLKASVDRVWRALTDAQQFGEWFRVKIEHPFVVGEPARGRILHPGYEHMTWEAVIVAMEPKRRFAFTWHPYGVDPAVDYSKETPTLVEFVISPAEQGSRLVVTESGFDTVQAQRRAEAFRMNEDGWSQQVRNIKAYVEA